MLMRAVLILVLACLTLPADALARELDEQPAVAEAPGTPDVSRPLQVDVVPATFRAAPATFRFNLSEGPLATTDVDQVVRIEYPLGVQGATEVPTPPAGWRVTRYVPDGAPASIELVAVATQQVREYMAVGLGVEPFACEADDQTFTWGIRVTSLTAGVDVTRNETTACDRIPPRLVHTSGDTLASVRAGSVNLTLDAVDEPVSTAPVYAKLNLSAPDGTQQALVDLVGGVANVTLDEGDGGAWRYHFEARDAAGNPLRVPSEGEFFLNVSEPVATVTLWGTPNGTWHNATPSVAFSLADAGSNASVLNWSVVSVPAEAAPGPAEGIGAANVTFGTGEHTLHVHTTDALGMREAEPVLALKVDAVVPTATIELNRTASADGWVAGPLNVTFNASYGPSGKKTATWAVGNATIANASTNLTEEGDHVVTWRAASVAGLVGTGERTLRLDLTAPVASLALTGNGSANVYRGAVLVNASATDARGVIATLEIIVDDGASTPYVGPVLVSGDRQHSVTLRATDLAGNVGQTTATFQIDDAPPSLILKLDGVEGATLANESGELTIDVIDEHLDTFSCTLDGDDVTLPLTVDAAGWHTVTCTGEDAAGNAASPAQLAFYVDQDAPTIEDLGDLGATNVPFFENTTSDVAGIRAVEARYVDAEGEAFAHPLAEPLADGVYALQLRATDTFGHVSPWSDALSFTLATAAPVPTFSASAENGAWTNDATYTWTLPSHLVDAWVEASVDGADFERVEGPLTLVGDGARTLDLRAADEAGNIGPATTFTVRLDTAAPDVAEPLGAFVHTNATAFTWTPAALADDGAPRFLSLAIDGVEVETANLTDEGAYALVYQALDAAGNEGPLYTSIVKIDRTAPLAFLADTVTANASGRLAWAAEDASPIAGLDARLVLANGTQAPLADVNETGASFADLPEGEHVVELSFTDAAGNAGAAVRRELVVDLTRPLVQIDAPAWTRGSVQVTVTASDALAGVARVRVVAIDGDNQTTTRSAAGAKASFTLDAASDLEVYGVAIDEAGNQIRSAGAIVRLDDHAPRIVVAHEQGSGRGVVATITDDRTEPASTYRICGDTCTGWLEYEGFLVRPASGFWLVEFRATDEAGNTALRSATFRAAPQDGSSDGREESAREDETQEREPEEQVTEEETTEEATEVVLDEPLPGTEPQPQPEPTRIVVKSARDADGKLFVDGPLTFRGDDLQSVTYRIGDGPAEVAEDGIIPDARIEDGETLIEVTYAWSDGSTTREQLVVVRESAEPEESIEQTSVTTPPPTGGAAAKRGAPGPGVVLALVALALVAAARRR